MVSRENLEKHYSIEKAFGNGRQEGHLVQHIICQRSNRGQLGERSAAHACHIRPNRLSVTLNKDVITTDQLVGSSFAPHKRDN